MPVIERVPAVKTHPVTLTASVLLSWLLSKRTLPYVLLVMMNFIDLSVTVPLRSFAYIAPRPTVDVGDLEMSMMPPVLFARLLPSPVTVNVPVVVSRRRPTGVAFAPVLPVTVIHLNVIASAVLAASMDALQLPEVHEAALPSTLMTDLPTPLTTPLTFTVPLLETFIPCPTPLVQMLSVPLKSMVALPLLVSVPAAPLARLIREPLLPRFCVPLNVIEGVLEQFCTRMPLPAFAAPAALPRVPEKISVPLEMPVVGPMSTRYCVPVLVMPP